MDLQRIITTFHENKNRDNQIPMEAYMRNQFTFLGIKSPLRASLSKEFLQRDFQWEEVFALWELPEREFQYLAIDWLKRRKNELQFSDLDDFKTIIQDKSWWDTIDPLSKIVGEVSRLEDQGKSKMLEWSRDPNFWVRRTAILHQLGFKDKTDKELLDTIIQNNLGSNEFFINKAIGWALREYSKTNAPWVRAWMDKNRDKLSPLTIREGSKYL